MMGRLRAVVWALAGLSLLTCLASLRWFPLASPDHHRLPATSALPDNTSAGREASTTYLSLTQGPPSPQRPLGDAATAAEDWSGWSGESGELQGRWTALVEACGAVDAAQVEELIHSPKMLNNLIVDDTHHTLYCYVPKVACTNWKRVMLVLTGRSNTTRLEDIPSDSVHRKNVFTKLSDLPPQEVLRRLQTYDKFVFVRHPVERVLSAFRNKFEKNYTSSAYFKKRFGVKIMKKYRGEGEAVPPDGSGVKFSEFISYLMDTRPDQLNEHWAPAAALCHPCLVRYNLVGKYESLAKDAEAILQHVGAPSSLHFPHVVPSKTRDHVDTYYNTLTPAQLHNFIKIYQEDFRVFDYHFRDLI